MADVERNTIELGKIVSRDPEIHSGDLVFAGTRVPVDCLVGYLKGGTPSKSSSWTIPRSSAGR